MSRRGRCEVKASLNLFEACREELIQIQVVGVRAFSFMRLSVRLRTKVGRRSEKRFAAQLVVPGLWVDFVHQNPDVGYRWGKWQFHNFLRFHRDALVASDVSRQAKKHFWIGHVERLPATASAYTTGVTESAVIPEGHALQAQGGRP
jgi:hypothetical protein